MAAMAFSLHCRAAAYPTASDTAPAELAGRHQLTVLHGQLSGGEHAVAVTHGGLVDHHGRHHVRDCDAVLGQLGFMPGAICTSSQPS